MTATLCKIKIHAMTHYVQMNLTTPNSTKQVVEKNWGWLGSNSELKMVANDDNFSHIIVFK